MDKNSVLKFTLYFIGIVQIGLGLSFLLTPKMYPQMVNLTQAPDWVSWMLSFGSIRMIGFGIGMFIAAQDPIKHKAWIQIMVGLQIMDWVGTVLYIFLGAVTLVQVSTASFLPIIFLVLLAYSYPRSTQGVSA